ncbi:MAG: HlyD family type secretion periplasmic adaptor subunit [Burkholderiaceae bacterium]|nr:HlyD family type secretion periplasmic adaptor subunit [Burkholderiaceae bacterium]
MKFLLKLLGAGPNGSLKNARVVLRISLIAFITLLIWASVTKIDKTITAQGQVIASDRTQLVQSADGGVLRELRVKEGDKVEKGQVVAVLEKERANASYNDALGKVSALRLTVTRLQAEVLGRPFLVDPQLEADYPELVAVQKSLYNQRRQGLIQQLSQLRTSLSLANQELKMNEPLVKSGDVSQSEVLRMRRAVNEIQLQISGARNKYLQDANTELNKASEDLSTQEQILADRSQVLSHTDLIAPETGIVKNIKTTTLGGVLRQGEEVMEILPTNSALIVEAKVLPVDMASVVQDMPARVKLDAYDYSIFGTMDGKVTYISPDALTEEQQKPGQPSIYYRVRVQIEGANFKTKTGQEIQVRPGMTAQVDLFADKRTVLSYITKPISKTLSESLSKK